MSKFILLLVCTAAFLSGCGARAKPIIGPDGREAYHVTCGGIQNSMTDCIEKAGEICGSRGYNILWSNAESPSGIAFDGRNYHQMQAFHRRLIIQCK